MFCILNNNIYLLSRYFITIYIIFIINQNYFMILLNFKFDSIDINASCFTIAHDNNFLSTSYKL